MRLCRRKEIQRSVSGNRSVHDQRNKSLEVLTIHSSPQSFSEALILRSLPVNPTSVRNLYGCWLNHGQRVLFEHPVAKLFETVFGRNQATRRIGTRGPASYGSTAGIAGRLEPLVIQHMKVPPHLRIFREQTY